MYLPRIVNGTFLRLTTTKPSKASLNDGLTLKYTSLPLILKYGLSSTGRLFPCSIRANTLESRGKPVNDDSR